MTNDTIFKQAVIDFQQVLTYKILNGVKKNWHDVSTFKGVFEHITKGCAAKRDACYFRESFSFAMSDARRIIGKTYEGDKQHWVTFADIKPLLPSWLHCRHGFTKRYKSGKSFRVHSYWYIEFSKLEELLADERWLDYNCEDIYTKRQRDLIWKIVYKHSKNEKASSEVSQKEQDLIENNKLEEKEENMTKAEKEQYQKEYDEGKRMLTLDQALKEEAKAKRRADKHRTTVAAKAAEKVLGNYQELVLENDSLKKQLAELLKRNTTLEAKVAQLKEAAPTAACSSREKELEEEVAELQAANVMLREDNDQLGLLADKLQAKLDAICPEKPDPEFEKQAAEFEKAVARLAPEIRKHENHVDSDARCPALSAAHPEDDIPTEEEQAREMLLDAEHEKELIEKLSIPKIQKYVSCGKLSPRVLKDVIKQLGIRYEVKECPFGFSPSELSAAMSESVYIQIPKLQARKQKLLREWQAA